MQDRSGNEAESKANPSGSQAPQHVPTFKAKLVLDAFSGVFCDRRGWAHLVLRTVSGEEFECFVDGIVAKGFSDRLLGLAGNLILQSHGESQDLRPLHELADDDADEERPIPKGLPAMAPQPIPETVDVHIQEHGLGYIAPRIPEAAATPKPGVFVDLTLTAGDPPPATNARATTEFLEDFGTTTPDELTNALTRKACRESITNADPQHPVVQKIKAMLSEFPEEA